MSDQDKEAMFNHLGMSAPSATLKQLWKDGYVLVHYDNQTSFDKEDYDEEPQDIEDLNDAITDDEAHLCLTRLANRHAGTTARKLGVIPKDADKLIVGIPDESPHTPEIISDTETAESRVDEFEYVYKGTKLEEDSLKELRGADYFLSAYEPPYTSFTAWPVVEHQLQALMAEESLPPKDPVSYATNQLELLCEEYLRIVDPSYCPLMDTGGPTGTHQVDLLGESEERTIYGEVKNTQSQPDTAVEKLGEIVREHPPKEQTAVDTYLFTRTHPNTTDDAVTVISLRSVLDTLWEHERTRRVMARITTNDITS
jgi:hypothetical protein